MSIAVSQPLHVPREPFGQTGVRQYLGSFSALVCAALVAASATLWFRSLSVMDTVEIYHEGSRTIMQSASGRFVFARVVTNPGEGGPGWAYNARQLTRPRPDRWPDSFWKTIGVEFRHDVIFGRQGWWFRFKWPTAALLCAIVPILHVFFQMRRKREAAQPAFEVVAYCPRCGRSTAASARRCGCCGRDLEAVGTPSAPPR